MKERENKNEEESEEDGEIDFHVKHLAQTLLG